MAVLIGFGFIMIFAGIIGCVLPIIPGPPLSYCSLILLSLAYKWEIFSPEFLVAMGIITLTVTVFDYILPLLTAKKFGASKYGIWGSILGMIIGIVIFPPFGLLIGAFLGAVLGEFIFNIDKKKSLKAGFGVFIGTILSIFIKLGTSGVIAFYFFKAVLQG
ncbi:hypothetical protein ES703_55086 [subsurface metagenome]